MTTALADARRGHRGLFAFAVAMAALTPVLAILALVDDRVLLGAPLWFKPLKFAISLALYAATLAWMLGQLRERAMQRTGWIVTAAARDRDGDHRGAGGGRASQPLQHRHAAQRRPVEHDGHDDRGALAGHPRRRAAFPARAGPRPGGHDRASAWASSSR